METDCTRHESAANGGVITPLPAGTRLLHIGPHKTGTTSIQGAMFAVKDRLGGYGVDWPATTRHPMEAVLAACARPGMMGDAGPSEKQWLQLVDKARGAGGAPRSSAASSSPTPPTTRSSRGSSGSSGASPYTS